MSPKLKKTQKKMNSLDKWTESLFFYISGAFEDEYITPRMDMDYKTKLWLKSEIEKTYQHIYPILKNYIVEDNFIDDLTTKLINDIIFILPILKDEWDDLYYELPLHYVTILGYITIRAEQKEKYEICSNIKKYFEKYSEKLINNNIIEDENNTRENG